MDAVKVDVNSIPDETGRRFGQCIIAGLREYLKQPGAREALDERTRARNERRKTSGYQSLPAVVR
jgi:hypothetical protein